MPGLSGQEQDDVPEDPAEAVHPEADGVGRAVHYLLTLVRARLVQLHYDVWD